MGCLLSVNKRVFPGRLPCRHPDICRRTISTGQNIKGPAPANFLLPKATATILPEATFKSRMGAAKSQKSGEVFLCTSYSLQNTNGQEVELICLACRRSQCWSIFPTPCRGQVHGRNLQLHADGNDARCDPIYMHMQMLMKCLCNALGMLMHACNLVGAPHSASFISLAQGHRPGFVQGVTCS